MGKMSRKIRVMVVDDSAFSRQTIKKMLESDEDIEVVAISTDGMDAMAKTLKLKPDLITLDFEMPEMDGFSFLRWLMQQRPTPVIMVSSYSDKKTVFMALELGAVDFVVKPSTRASVELLGIQKDLLAKVKGMTGMNMNVLSSNIRRIEERERKSSGTKPSRHDIDLVAIGSSTGGPPALQMILSGLPSDFSAGIIISQHMPKGFTKPLADRLDKLIGMHVKEAEDGDEIEKGLVLICPGSHHMTLKKRGKKVRVVLKKAVFEDKYAPSVDIMMKSASEHFGPNVMGVVLTGMGNDGTKGMLSISEKGGLTMVESEETSVVFGMPAEVINAGAARMVLPLYRISTEMYMYVSGERRI
jgi:two-component system chemotaxis response regulator CheB